MTGTTEECPYCKKQTLEFKETPETIHYGRIDCKSCGRWIKWVMNPKYEGQRRKTSKYKTDDVMRFHNFNGEPFCFLCLRKKEHLGVKETLTIDHIKELDKDGEDTLSNLQILCFACHKLKNWLKLYLNWHLTSVE